MDIVERITALHRRILSAGHGRLLLPPARPLEGPIGTINVRPTPAERTEIADLLSRLARDYGFTYSRDQLELTYENGGLTLARISFAA